MSRTCSRKCSTLCAHWLTPVKSNSDGTSRKNRGNSRCGGGNELARIRLRDLFPIEEYIDLIEALENPVDSSCVECASQTDGCHLVPGMVRVERDEFLVER